MRRDEGECGGGCSPRAAPGQIYFFHRIRGEARIEDRKGMALPDATAIATQALSAARSIMAKDVMRGKLDFDQRIEVADQSGAVVHTLWFAWAVTINVSLESFASRHPDHKRPA